MFNLISNAIKFKRDDTPEIHIKTMMQDDHVILSVEDNGIGIPKAEQETIFKMYKRLNHDVDGHGIGLYLAKKIVDATSGNITVESEHGKGSKFMIHFKAEEEPA
ncbi:MAG: chemotaxis protein CheR [Mucilaginibacter sp.]|nr:chemotaxis protein CheR [Mucilaginibacter sp.]